jgi:hypothetical protein
MANSLDLLKSFQVEPRYADREDIDKLKNKIKSSTRASELNYLFENNISLLAYFLRIGYIKYEEIYFLSTDILEDEEKRPDYICCAVDRKSRVSWYAIDLASPADLSWDDTLQPTPTAKKLLDGLRYSCQNLERSILKSQLVPEVDPDRIYGLLIIGTDREFTQSSKKQDRKRKLNQSSTVRLRTYSSFTRHLERRSQRNWLTQPLKQVRNLLFTR